MKNEKVYHRIRGYFVCSLSPIYRISLTEAKVNLKLGHIRAETSPTHLAALRFAEIVEKKTGVKSKSRSIPTVNWEELSTCLQG